MRASFTQSWALGLFLLGNPAVLHSAENCAGAPFVNVVRPRSIEESAGAIVGPQIFAVAPHPGGFVLMANNYGLLTYDGVAWRLMPLGRAAVALSVAVGPGGRTFAGGSRTFGEVIEDPTGKLLYQSLEGRLSAQDRSFTDVWQTLVSGAGVAYFRAPERIIVLRNGDAQALSPIGRFSAADLEKEVLYVHDTGRGLISIEGDRVDLVRGGGALKDVRVTAMTQGPGASLLVGTEDAGLFEFDLASGRSRRLGSSVPDLQAAEILSLKRLPDGQIAVGTLRSGLFVLDKDGGLRFRMDRDSGLPDNAVLTLEASNGSLWAGTSGGVAQLLMPNSVLGFSGREGLPGIVEALARHDGSIFAATSQGVFRMTCGARAFAPVASLRKQSFALLEHGGALLAATADGIYEIDGASVRLVRSGLARGLSRSKDPNRIWAATQSGPASLILRNGRWAEEARVAFERGGVSPDEELEGIEATSVGEDADGLLWISLVTGRVISGLPVTRDGAIELTAMTTFGEAEGISGFAEVLALEGGLRIGTATAVLRPEGRRLFPDARFAAALGAGRGAFRIKDALDGGYWVASAKRPLRLTADKSGNGLAIRSTALLRAPAGSRILDFLELSPSEVWIGTDDGAFRYDPSVEAQVTGPVAAFVRRVQSGQDDLFSGGSSDSLEAELPHLAPLRFEVASSSLDDPSRNRFRFRLDGQDTEWSPWTAETRKDYTNLGRGSYRFRVETRDVYGRVGKEASFSFVVATPWYQKGWATALGLGALVGVLFGAVQVRTRTLRRRQGELEVIVEQKTSELREASFTDPLTGLRNRRYFAEVIESEASLACRPGSPALHLFLVDLDHFKQVNDTHGHAAGDEILRQTAARLKTAMRTSDLIFRWGGEEFLIVARGAADLPRNEIANRIVRMLGNAPFDIGSGILLQRTCSVGFATYPFYPDNPTTVPLDAVIELADLSLYRAKETGRNRAVGVSPQSGAPVVGDLWKNQLLENLEKTAVSVEILEGPAPATLGSTRKAEPDR